MDAWCRRIVAAHLEALSALDCGVCLISDYASIKRDRQGAVIEEGPTLYGCALPEPAQSWTWSIAPLGELSRRFSRELRVGVWRGTR